MKEKLTLEKFNSIPRGGVIASGNLPDSPEGINMMNTGKELRWIAKKGDSPHGDWAIYCYWSNFDDEYILSMGDKVTTEYNIKQCVNCTDSVYKLYRR